MEDWSFALSPLQSICVPPSIEKLSPSCLSAFGLRTLIFQPGSRGASIGGKCLFQCQFLGFVYVPRSGQIIADSCFLRAAAVVTVTFDTNSRPARIED
jgi:hypothetical protein